MASLCRGSGIDKRREYQKSFALSALCNVHSTASQYSRRSSCNQTKRARSMSTNGSKRCIASNRMRAIYRSRGVSEVK